MLERAQLYLTEWQRSCVGAMLVGLAEICPLEFSENLRLLEKQAMVRCLAGGILRKKYLREGAVTMEGKPLGT